MEVTRFENPKSNNFENSDLLTLSHRRPFRFRSSLTNESFESLLNWLAPGRDDAGVRYEEIRAILIKIFTYRGCPIAEDLADETINRVAERVDRIVDSYVGEPSRYFYGVANKVHLEYLNRPKITVPPVDVKTQEEEFQSLDSCLQKLRAGDRQLVFDYYGKEKASKISERKAIAESLGISLNALRVRLFGIRSMLRRCMERAGHEVKK